MKQLIALIFTCILIFSITGCSKNRDDNKVVIYSSSEEFRNEHIIKRLKEQFPEYDITLQYQSTGNNAAKLKAEGTKTECDIVIGLESGYMEQLKDNFADLSMYDNSVFLDELVPTHYKYFPWERFSGAIIVSPKVLAEKNLQEPQTYQDLLKPEYRGLISMPNPKSSGTGYFFYLQIVNMLGEEKALEFFDSLADNILQFTSSGSGPVNALVQGEVAIGLGMTFQAVGEINKGTELKMIFPPEGAPYTTGSFAMIDGRQDKRAVQDVFQFFLSTLIYEDKAMFTPEQIFKEHSNLIANYPQSIVYTDMTGINVASEKERLLEKWKY